jgi:hypothetical protein
MYWLFKSFLELGHSALKVLEVAKARRDLKFLKFASLDGISTGS